MRFKASKPYNPQAPGLYINEKAGRYGSGPNSSAQKGRRQTFSNGTPCTIIIRDVKDCTISLLLSMAMNMLFMMVRHAQKVKGEA